MNPWLLFILPLASAAIIQLGLKRSAMGSSLLSTASAVITFMIALMLLGNDITASPLEWIRVSGLDLELGLQLDQLSKGMMIVVTGIGMLVHIFSLGYMQDDEAKARYFGGLSLFMFSMTGIVLASNFIMMFIFWELVGLSSYLLIGHWYQKDSAADAAKKRLSSLIWKAASSRLSAPASQARSFYSSSVERLENPPNCHSTSGFPMPWKAPPRSPRSFTPPPW